MTNRSKFLAQALVLAIVASGAGHGMSLAQSPTEDDGQQLVLQAARNLLALPGIDAEFNYRTQAYDQSLQGTGRYLQFGGGPEKLFRLELNTQLDDYKASQQTISGRQYLWIRRDLGPDQRSLGRIQLRQLKQALDAAGPPLSLDPSPTWLGIISLPKMLGSLANWFEFEPAEEAMLSDRQVLRLRGQIKADLRSQLVSGSKGKGGEQIPDAIELILGTDKALPLFPYRLEYLKRPPKDKSGVLTPLLTLDFISVKVRGDLDPQQFEYYPGDQEVEDRTRLFLDRLGFQAKPER